MELSEIRNNIDSIDRQLLALFLERMKLSEKAAEYKSLHGLPILNREREREILAQMAKNSGDMEKYTYHLFSVLFELSRTRQAELSAHTGGISELLNKYTERSNKLFPQTASVACQGTEGANSVTACEKLFPRGHVVCFKTFEAVVSAVQSGLCEFGILPIENSSNGSVRRVYELMRDSKLSIVRSLRLCISHELLALPEVKQEDITEIYSHEQALGQCSEFLDSLNGVSIIPCSNTATAARAVAESKNDHAAAISSHACAQLYGLSCINDRIQNSDNNYTRFICVSKEPRIYDGANRLSLILSFDNRPGALYEILAKLAVLDINLTKLESCPVTGSDFEFIFFLEMEASLWDKSVVAMLAEIERSCSRLVFLGSYSQV